MSMLNWLEGGASTRAVERWTRLFRAPNLVKRISIGRADQGRHDPPDRRDPADAGDRLKLSSRANPCRICVLPTQSHFGKLGIEI